MKKIIKKIARKFFNFFNRKLIKETYWYKSNYGDLVKMKNWRTFNLDLAVFGSSAVKHGFDCSAAKINAANWAIAPQDSYTSFAIMKNYSSFVREGGILLLLLLCPFQALSNRGVPKRENIEYWDKYHYFLSPVLVKHFSEETLKRVKKEIECPFFVSPKTAVKQIIKTMLGKNKPQEPTAKTDAQNRIDSWKKQFSIENFADPLSEENLKAIEYNINILCEIAEFCKERSFEPIFGIMPTTRTLKDHIPSDFIQRAFYDMVEEVEKRTGVQFLDYYRSPEFESEDLYLDSFLMNEKGRKLFTERVLEDLGLSAERRVI